MSDSAASEPPEPEIPFNIGDAEDSLERMCELNARFGDIYRVYSPGRRRYAYVINHPDDVRRVLVSNHANYTKGFGLDRVKMLLGNGLVTSEGEFWRSQRYLMQPMFHRRVITQFAAVIAAANEQLLARWEQRAAAGELINVTDEMSELTLEVILRAVFGSDLDRLSEQLGGNPFQIITRDPARDLTFAYRFRQLRKLVGELAERRRTDTAEHFDFIGMLVSARHRATGEPMGERALIDEVMTLIIAGHETAASTLNSAWYLLSQHPEALARLHAELDAAPEQDVPDLAATEALPYTRSVLQETLRLYPAVWLLSRKTLGPDLLAGFAIPTGVDVLLSPYLIHRHPRFWSEPESFRPERAEFAPQAQRPPFAYVPFSAGPRHCIGESMALFEMCVHLYKIARRYRLIYPPGQPMQLEALINLRTRQPLMMRLQRR
ncbi:MAG TPA: cytochrome P450 [Steroidobacteraceae bacterium]|nr:cytochrome P450 [Steroidobacteraceae bacterium]